MAKYHGKTITEILAGIPSTQKRAAEAYLNGDKVRSVKFFRDELDPNEFEAFIVEDGETVLLPGVEVNDRFKVQDIHCQCGIDNEFCIHEVALLIAVQFMMEKDSADYHSAKKQWFSSQWKLQ